MSRSSVALSLSLLVCASCLAGATLAMGRWEGLSGIPLAVLFWVAGQRRAPAGLPTAGFLLYLCLAVIEILAGANTFWVLLGSVAALAAWDLASFKAGLNKTAQGATVMAGSSHPADLETRHLRWLGLAALSGFLLGSAGLLWQLNLPFIGMGACIILTFVGLSQALRWLKAALESVKPVDKTGE